MVNIMIDKENQLNIIIDTDPGTDDLLAIALCTILFKNNICAMISSFGNVNGIQTYNNLINLAHLLKIDCNILQGSMLPTDNRNVKYTDYHGSDGLCGVKIPTIEYCKKLNIEETNNIDVLYKIIKNKKSIKYISIAPLTNFSKLLKNHPDVVEYIDELIIMGGGLNCSNTDNNAEYNFSLDGKAVQQTLKSSIKKTICPLDMTRKLSYSEKEIEMIVGHKRREVFSNNTPYSLIAQIFFKNYDTAILHNETGAIIHDATTFLYILSPDKCQTTMKRISANSYGSIQYNPDGKLVKIIENIDKNFVTTVLQEMFKKLER